MDYIKKLLHRIRFLLAVTVLVNILFVLLMVTGGLHFFQFVKYAFYFNLLFVPLVMLIGIIYRITSKNYEHAFDVPLIIAASLLLYIMVYSSMIEPYNLKVRRVTIRSSKIHKKITILHISDIQTDEVGAYEKKVFRMVASLKPDLILHTGDLIQTGDRVLNIVELNKLASLFRKLRSPLGIYNVRGNVDYGLNSVSFDKKSGIKTLKDKTIVLKTERSSLVIHGLSLPSSGRPDVGALRRILKKHPKAFHIVMGHRPDYMNYIRHLPLNLSLAGHTHGGQVRLPFFGPLMTLSRISRQYARGFHKWGMGYINVSAGIGAEHHHGLPPIRFNCPPEVSVITLLPLTK